MPFGVAAAGISAAAGIAGGLMQSSAASSASNKALGFQEAALEQSRNDLMPWTSAGGAAVGAGADLLGLNGQDAANAAMANFQQSPGYQWQLGQGLRAVDAGAAARGMLRSGATLKAEQTFGSGLADQEFGNYWNRLMNLSNAGATAAGANTQAGVNLGNAMAGTATGAGNAQSSIYGNVASGIGSSISGLMNNTDFRSWISGGVNPTTVNANQLYQQGAFASQPPGTYGPFQ